MSRVRSFFCKAAFLAVVGIASTARADDSLVWGTNTNSVAVDIKDWDLLKLLKKIAAASGWHIFVEPGTTAHITARFKNVSSDEALNRLLGNISFSLDASNGVSRLRVFHTAAIAATEALEPSPPTRDYRIPNELIVRLRRNSNESIDDIAKALGGKVVGRDDRLNLYRLQFADADAANAAATQLNSDPSVGMIDSNYVVDRPAPVQMNPLPNPAPGVATPASGPGTGSTTPALSVNPPVNGVVIGLVDTAVQMQNGLSQYSLPALSVVGQPDEPTGQLSHGTAMFETLVQNMASDPSRILPVDVYPTGDSTTTFQLVEGIVAAIQGGANVINLSCGGTGGTGDSSTLQSLIAEGTQKGVLFVAASGNGGGTAPTYPAAYPGVLAITASAPNGQLASYADDGSFVQAMAPGTSTVYLNGQAWQVEGTSPATAYATAAITQIINEQHVSLSQAVTQFIQSHPPPR